MVRFKCGCWKFKRYATEIDTVECMHQNSWPHFLPFDFSSLFSLTRLSKQKSKCKSFVSPWFVEKEMATSGTNTNLTCSVIIDFNDIGILWQWILFLYPCDQYLYIMNNLPFWLPNNATGGIEAKGLTHLEHLSSPLSLGSF